MELDSQPPRRGLKYSGFAILALLAVLVIGDQIRLHRPEYKFRLRVDVETPLGLRSGEGVLSVTPNRGYGGSDSGEASGPQTAGDAVFVDLGDGRNLVALLVVGTDPGDLEATNYLAMRSFNAAGRQVQFRTMKKTTGQPPVAVPSEFAPELVSFKDVSDPTSARLVTAATIGEVLGPGYALRGVFVSTAPNGFWPLDFGGALGTPVSRGITQKLPWLKGGADAAARALAAAGIRLRHASDAKQAFER
jgi:hypothetical protein